MPVLSPAERDALRAVAETAIPAGRIFPAAGDSAIERLERFLAESPAPVRAGYRALLASFEHGARLGHGRRFSRLDERARLACLDRWHRGSYPRRMALRALLTPIKMAHLDDPALFAAVNCPYGAETPAVIERPRWLDRVADGADVRGTEEIECDVVVVGTGAGGAVVARELAERGVAVVLLEEGKWHTRRDFTGHAVQMQRKLYRDMGATVALGTAPIPIPVGRGVGGTTTVNAGTCYRAPSRVLAKWRGELGLGELTPDHLAPYYERVEGVLGVAPADPRHLGGVARVIARGCDALGWKHGPLRRNAPDCDGRGICCFGCPTDAKRSTNVSYVPMALRAGAQLYTGARVTRVIVEGGRAAGVLARTAGGGSLRVRARATAAACGTLLTPLLLSRSGVANRHVGRNLSIHPAVGVGAVFEESIAMARAIPQGYCIEEFHDEGLLFEGASVPLDVGGAAVAAYGARFTEIMEAFDRTATFGFMIEDRSRGRVRAGPAGRPLITYNLDDGDAARLKRGVEILARVYFAAGARSVLPFCAGFDELADLRDVETFRHARVAARDFDITAYHPLGTARIAGDAGAGVCNADHEVWELPGLYVTDGAAVPSSLAVNPQLTIMALATRAAERMAERLG